MDLESVDEFQNADLVSDGSQSPSDVSGSRQAKQSDSNSAGIRRIACIICRKRKLKCDGARPSCHTCSRLGHQCGYDEVRRKSGPKRGYVKELEARLKVVESQLKSKQTGSQSQLLTSSSKAKSSDSSAAFAGQSLMGLPDTTGGSIGFTSGMNVPNVLVTSEKNTGSMSEFSWQMIGLGLEEPLPPQDMIDELHQVYFDKMHYSWPMIHKYRYLAAMNLAPSMRPSTCLRYSIWALTCSIVDKYSGYADIFYQRARKYAELDEMKGHGESFVTVGHCQAWALISMFEFKMLYFPRAWMSAGRAARLATMLGLHRQDGPALEVKQTLPPPRDWTDREERRRTFWMAYSVDRYASIGTGWPMTLDELDICTNLPSSNDSYEKSRKEDTVSLAEGMTASGAPKLSSFAGVVLLACIFGKNLTHLHRASDSDAPGDPSGEFWKRHQKLDSTLLNISMYLPDHLKIPGYAKDPNVVALNMYIHSAKICLHQAAILKAEKHGMTESIIRESTEHCFLAATELARLMRMVTPLDTAYLNPFASFCLYVAARVFLHAYMKRPSDQSIREPLFFLLSAMQAHRSKNNLTESFLVQLQVELDAAGLEHPLHNRDTYRGSKSPYVIHEEGKNCPPVFPAHSATQPSYAELNSQKTPSPALVNARISVDSPPTRFQSSFAVPSRTRQTTTGINTAAQHSAQVPSQMWNDSSTAASFYRPQLVGEVEISSDGTPPSATSHRGSSNTSYSPHAHEDAAALEGMQAVSGVQGQFFATPSGAFDPFQSQHDFGVANASGHHAAEAGLEDWGIDNVQVLGDGSWTMEAMTWEDGSGMQQGMGV